MLSFLSMNESQLKRARTALRLTQEEVARLARVSHRSYNTHETRKAGRCDVKNQRRIAEALCTTPEKLFNREGYAR